MLDQDIPIVHAKYMTEGHTRIGDKSLALSVKEEATAKQ